MKPFNLPIMHNPLISREDCVSALLDILAPCKDALVYSGTGLFVGNGSTSYSDRVGLLEGWSRLLWGLAPLTSQNGLWDGSAEHFRGFINGPDPSHPCYWGDIKDGDQRMVEMAAVSYSLLLDRKNYWDVLTASQKQNLKKYMLSMNGKRMPQNNWVFFRILVNEAFRYLGEEYDSDQLEKDIAFIESLYVGDGWYRDNVPFDNYNTFALHFYGIFLYRYILDAYPDFASHIKERAFLYAEQHKHILLDDGKTVPYGRSLTYRFALVSFYSACAFAGFEVLPWGVMKGIVLRNLRWWFREPIFDRDGFLTIGYAYPDLIMSERYNGQGSPYWALKTFLILALDASHPFWQSEERKLPEMENVFERRVPHEIVQRTSDDVIILSAGQYPVSEIAHASEKYSKFAYSAQFGFSVSISGWGYDKTGSDSMLFVSLKDGYFRPRRKCVAENKDGYLKSLWSPYEGVGIVTYLIPAGNFHIRVHRISTKHSLETMEGGFAIPRYQGFEIEKDPYIKREEHAIMIGFNWASSYIASVSGGVADYIMPSSNLNLMSACTLVPYIRKEYEADTVSYTVSIVGASLESENLKEKPSVFFDENKSLLSIDGKIYSLG